MTGFEDLVELKLQNQGCHLFHNPPPLIAVKSVIVCLPTGFYTAALRWRDRKWKVPRRIAYMAAIGMTLTVGTLWAVSIKQILVWIKKHVVKSQQPEFSINFQIFS